METAAVQSKMSFSRPSDDTLLVRLAGGWRIGQELPAAGDVQQQIETRSGIKQLTFNTEALTGWDSL
jgi:hypothetical protein